MNRTLGYFNTVFVTRLYYNLESDYVGNLISPFLPLLLKKGKGEAYFKAFQDLGS